MYEAAVKDALFTLIDNNRATLLSGLDEQGVARKIELTREVVASMKFPYYVTLAVGAMRMWEDTGAQGGIARAGTMKAEYDCEIELFDYARDVQGTLHEAYATTGQHFDLLMARVLKLIRQQTRFTSTTHGTHTFVLKESPEPQMNRRIDTDVTDFPSEVTGGVPAFYAKLRFTLFEECVSLAGA